MRKDRTGFPDRREAGRRLATALERFRGADPVVLALPRGGVPVAYEVAQALGAPLDVVLVRKIGAPGQPELGLGAVADGAQPTVAIDQALVEALRPPPGYIEDETRRQLGEIARRRERYASVRPGVPIAGRVVILVDDGIATGGTARAALRALSQQGAARLVLAVPVAASESLAMLRPDADEIVCLLAPTLMSAVGNYYTDFDATPEQEVIDLLQTAGRRAYLRR